MRLVRATYALSYAPPRACIPTVWLSALLTSELFEDYMWTFYGKSLVRC